MRSDFVWHINLDKGAPIVAMQISHEISNSATKFGVELSCRWQQILFHGRDDLVGLVHRSFNNQDVLSYKYITNE